MCEHFEANNVVICNIAKYVVVTLKQLPDLVFFDHCELHENVKFLHFLNCYLVATQCILLACV